MAIRTFIFCDACNPQGIRAISDETGRCRRSSDQRSWFEGEADEAINHGWDMTTEGLHLCPKCQNNGLGQLLLEKHHGIQRDTPILQFRVNVPGRD